MTVGLVGSIKRKAVIFGLMAMGALIALFAIGYALDAGHTLLAFRLGPIYASLIIAALLLTAAGASVGAALFIGRQRAPQAKAPDRASQYSHAPYRAIYPPKRTVALVALGAGAFTTATAIVGITPLRRLISGKRPLLDRRMERDERVDPSARDR